MCIELFAVFPDEFFFSFGLYQYLLSCSVIWPPLHSLSFFLFNLSLSLSLHLARSLYILIIFAKIQILASFIVSIVFCFQFHWFLFHIAFFAPIAAIKGLLGDWGVREQRKEKFNDEFLYSESLQCLFSLLEPAYPGALQVFSLEPTSMFSGCVEFKMGGYWRGKKNDKFTTSSMVLQILVFFPKLLANFYVSEPSSTLSCFYSFSQSVQPGGVCFFYMIQNWKISPTFFEPGQKRAWDLIHWVILLSSITTTAPSPWVYLPQPSFYHHCISKSSIGIVCNWSWGSFDVWHTEEYIEPRQIRSISSFRDQFLLFKN